MNKNDGTWCENGSKTFSLTEVCQGLSQVVKLEFLAQCAVVVRSLGTTPARMKLIINPLKKYVEYLLLF